MPQHKSKVPNEHTRLVEAINAKITELNSDSPELAVVNKSELAGRIYKWMTLLLRQIPEIGLIMGNGYIFYNSLRHIVEGYFHCVRQPDTRGQTHIMCPNRAALPLSVLAGTNAWYVNSVLAYRSTNEFIERFLEPGFANKFKSGLSFIGGLATISPVTVYGLSGQIHRGFKHLAPIEVFDLTMSILSSLANAFVYGNSYFHLKRVAHKLKKIFIQAPWPAKLGIVFYAAMVALATLGYGYNNYHYFQPTIYEAEYTRGLAERLEKLGIGIVAGIFALLRFPLLLDSGVQLLDFLKKELQLSNQYWQEGLRGWAVARTLPAAGFAMLSSLSTLSITRITQQSIVQSHPCPTHRTPIVQHRCHNKVNVWSWVDSIGVAIIAAIINFISLPASFSSPQRIFLSLALLLSITVFVSIDSLLLDRFRPIERPAPARANMRFSLWHPAQNEQLLNEEPRLNNMERSRLALN